MCAALLNEEIRECFPGARQGVSGSFQFLGVENFLDATVSKPPLYPLIPLTLQGALGEPPKLHQTNSRDLSVLPALRERGVFSAARPRPQAHPIEGSVLPRMTSAFFLLNSGHSVHYPDTAATKLPALRNLHRSLPMGAAGRSYRSPTIWFQGGRKKERALLEAQAAIGSQRPDSQPSDGPPLR